MRKEAENPFKYGTVVAGEYFTDRTKEVIEIEHALMSPNHLVLISPRRFGKSSLVKKAVEQVERPALFVNMQQITGVENLASTLLKGIFRLFPGEKLKHLMAHFRIIPTISTNPLTDSIDLSFPVSTNATTVLEDVMQLIDNIGASKGRLIVVFDKFQDILELRDGIDKELRAMMQIQENVNYIFLGSQESMMTDIFERKKSPFYHFGKLMYLSKIPYSDFLGYIVSRLSPVAEASAQSIAENILSFTGCHPYYTQQLSSEVWEIAMYESSEQDIVSQAINKIVTTHDYDYERLWVNFNITDRKILQAICLDSISEMKRKMPSSTFSSSMQRLMKKGYVIRIDKYELEDPFFCRWILSKLH